ncbi:hypothetical protein ASG88_20355 [Nocardioides sp. Soil777]|uniref:hypothetical protein n=1 Tax=Nocardioides sp. Soil777 TaxID=1736409 RepID=UPI0007033CDA|nr:hypothetical protein [Nocardioides sp. Soil777]KRF06496.1 hypothetical protein ASG88_20355 [Nocardioides sp. Soil777]
MNRTDDDLALLVALEPTSTRSPDLGAIRSAGRRLERRRRAIHGVAALAVVGALGVPAALVATHGGAGVTPTPTPAPATTTPSVTEDGTGPVDQLTDAPPEVISRGCGVLGCPRDAVPETGEVVGEPWAVAALANGTDEVFYAVRPSPASEVVVATGFVVDGDLQRLALPLRPGGEPLQLVGGGRRQGPDGASYSIVGLAEDATEVSWQSRPGTWYGTIENRDLVPGWTVFHVSGQWDASWPASGGALVSLRIDGEVVHGG